MSEAPTRSSSAATMLLLVVLSVAASVPALWVPFIWDDHLVIRPALEAHRLRNIPGYFTADYWRQAAESSGSARPYRPVRETAFTAILAAGGGAEAFHLTSIGLHALNVLLLFLLISAVLRSPMAAFLSAALFAVHPAHTEALVWAKNVGESLALSLMILSMLCFAAMERRQGARRVTLYIGSLLAYALALGAKESAAPLPLLLLIWWWVRPDGSKRGSVRECVLALAPFFLLAVGYAYFQLRLMAAASGPAAPAALGDSGVRLALATETVWRYVRLLTLPFGLHGWHDMPLPTGLGTAHAVGFVLLLVAIVAALVRRPSDTLAFGLLWMTAALLPVANLVAANAGRPIAEQRLYTPSAGWCVLLGAAWAAALSVSEKRRAATALFRASAAVFLVMGWAAAVPWAQSERLFRHSVRWSPGVAGAHSMLGTAYAVRGRLAMAFEQQSRACRMRPRHAKYQNNLASVCRRMGRLDEAVSRFRKAAALRPGYVKAAVGLASCLADKGDLDDALREAERAIALRGGNADLYNLRGDLLARQGKMTEAAESFRRAVGLDSRHVDAQANLGTALMVQGRYAQARTAYLRVTQLAPDYAEAHAKLGLSLAYLRQYDEAVQSLRRALMLNPRHFEARHTLARALATQKQFARAARTFSHCLASPEAATRPRAQRLKLHEQAAHSFERAGRHADALTQWREILKLKPDHPHAAAALRRLSASGPKGDRE